MTERDSAFLWETEALRGESPRSARPARPGEVERSAADWVTLREASAVTGVPVATLRKWALKDGVPSYLEETAVGQLRMISLAGVYRRAEDLGRVVERRAEAPVRPKVVDLPTRPIAPPAQPDIPEGTMLVPLDTWTKVLNQLGNLHEAGQQLAEARERAARSETEAMFLRERLAELRAELAKEQPGPPSESSESVPAKTRSSAWSALRALLSAMKRPRG